MTPNEYITNVLRTESKDVDAIMKRLSEMTVQQQRLLHAAFGVVTEGGEFADIFKKYIFYGKPVDVTNVMEECGDLLWYTALCLNAIGLSFEEVMERNIAKLKARYPEGFTEADALNRDLEKERSILENNCVPLEPIYYMRDNHTFSKLDEDIEKAIVQVREEFAAGYTFGMLCTKRVKAPEAVHARGKFARFTVVMRDWYRELHEGAK